MRNMAEKRHNDWSKAKRKRKISQEVYGIDWYDNLHQYSDNKIHCSCPMCSTKTNNRKQLDTWHGTRGKKNWSIMDRRRIEEMDNQLFDNEENF